MGIEHLPSKPKPGGCKVAPANCVRRPKVTEAEVTGILAQARENPQLVTTFSALRRPGVKAPNPQHRVLVSNRFVGVALHCEAPGCDHLYVFRDVWQPVLRPWLCPECRHARGAGAVNFVPREPTEAENIAKATVAAVVKKVRRRQRQVAKVVTGNASRTNAVEPPTEAQLAQLALQELADQHGIEVPREAAPAPLEQVISVEAAVQAEIASRELARRKLLHFVQRHRPKYLAGWFHIDLCARLEKFAQDVIDGKSPRLLIEAPPRHGKSTLVSEDFPPWFFGHAPEMEIIATAYSSALAFEFSRKVQETMRSPDYRQLFGDLTVREGNESIETWANSKGGKYLAAGAGGPITGRGAHALLIEDPFKNREDADSPTVRKKIWDWYTSTAYTRLAPGGGVCIIHTRWHQDDLIGRQRQAMKEAERVQRDTGTWPEDVDKWEIVSYPAIATEEEPYRHAGEALHPERYPLPALLRIRRTIGPRDWSALYQQNPVPEEGAYFAKDMIKYYKGEPPPGKIFVTVDLAISKAQYADYTVFLVWCVDVDGNLYLIDAVRDRMAAGQIIDTFLAQQGRYAPYVFAVERGAIYEAIMPLLEKTIREKQLYQLRVEPVAVGNRDKSTRARSIQGRMSQGKVYFKEGARYLDWLIDEVLSFPHAKNDDGVDAMATAGTLVNDVVFYPPPAKKSASWRDKLHKYVSGSGDSTRHPAMGA